LFSFEAKQHFSDAKQKTKQSKMKQNRMKNEKKNQTKKAINQIENYMQHGHITRNAVWSCSKDKHVSLLYRYNYCRKEINIFIFYSILFYQSGE
jgi:hypothetical protein